MLLGVAAGDLPSSFEKAMDDVSLESDSSLEQFLDNASLNLGDNFLEGEKIVFKFNSFFALDFVLRQEEISLDSLGGVDSILGKEGVYAPFTFEVEAFSIVGRIGEAKCDAFDFLFKGR